jgi:hypothetical protein
MEISKTYIRTGRPEFDQLPEMVRKFLEQDTLTVDIDGQTITGYRSPDARSIWIRDHSDMMRAAKYFQTDLKSTVDHFAETQSANGRIFDYFTTFPEKLPCERENWTKYVRVPVEADVEFRFIKAAFLAWQATGDDEWILRLIPALERALEYIFTNPQRTDPETGLVKRAYTIDTWDFAYTAGKHDWLQFQLNDETYWGIFHGDNSGYFEALSIMEVLYGYFGEKADGRGQKAIISKKREDLRNRTNEICWNGAYYTHFVKITPVVIAGVDESKQLSMANPMSINRGIATHEMAVSILREYQRRKETTRAFAEWFSVDPPFPDGVFGDEKLVGGAYINGGIFPLAGGELARAAFEHGFEEYGVSILKQYYNLIAASGETYLWYFPDGSPTTVETSTSPEAMPTDGWGSSAMAWALIEGLAGIEDKLKSFSRIRISPRWLAAGINEAEVGVGYAAGAGAGEEIRAGEEGPGFRRDDKGGFRRDDNASVEYLFRYTHLLLELTVLCNAEADFHILTGTGDEPVIVEIDGVTIDFQGEMIEQSRYVNFSAKVEGRAEIRITFKG